MYLISRLFFVVAIGGYGVAAAKKSPPPVLKTSSLSTLPALKNQLEVRGGAGPLNPTLVAKAATVTALGQGFLSSQAPEPCLEIYGMDKGNPVAAAWMRLFGASVLAIGVTGLCLFFKETDASTAFGWMSTMWAAEHLRGLLNQEESKLGANPTGRMLWLILDACMAYVCFTSPDNMENILKAFGAFTILSCGCLALDPKGGAKLYGFQDQDLNADTLACVRASGFWISANGAFFLLSGIGLDAQKAFGIAWAAPMVAVFTMLFVTKEFDKPNVNKTPILAWLLFHAATVVALAIPKSAASVMD